MYHISTKKCWTIEMHVSQIRGMRGNKTNDYFFIKKSTIPYREDSQTFYYQLEDGLYQIEQGEQKVYIRIHEGYGEYVSEREARELAHHIYTQEIAVKYTTDETLISLLHGDMKEEVMNIYDDALDKVLQVSQTHDRSIDDYYIKELFELLISDVDHRLVKSKQPNIKAIDNRKGRVERIIRTLCLHVTKKVQRINNTNVVGNESMYSREMSFLLQQTINEIELENL